MEIKTHLIPITWLGNLPHGYACGYVGVPPEHPWFGMDYDTLHNNYPHVSIHGGLTYASDSLPIQKPDGLWWVGFDTSHGGDTLHNCSKVFCEQEVERLKQQALEALTISTRVETEL